MSSKQAPIILTLRNGAVSYPASNALWDGPVAEFFGSAKAALKSDTEKQLSEKWDDDGDDDYPQNFYNFFLERVLFYVRAKGHGGTLLFLPPYIAHDDSRLTDRVVFKYSCCYDWVWTLLIRSLVNHRNYYDSLFAIRDGKTTTKEGFGQFTDLLNEKELIDEAILDVAQAVASMTAVDGAVVLTDSPFWVSVEKLPLSPLRYRQFVSLQQMRSFQLIHLEQGIVQLFDSVLPLRIRLRSSFHKTAA